MLMVSSSAIISKVLQELGATHEKSGPMAMGVSVLEDVFAIVMLTDPQLAGPTNSATPRASAWASP